MSSKFVLGILLPALVVIGLALLLRQSFTRTPPSPQSVAAPAPAPQSAANNMPAPLPLPAVTAPAPPPMTDEERQEAIDRERDRLYDWGMNRNPQSLSNVLADLYSPEKDIRMAAIDATEQLHDTNAIPVLKAIAMTNEDSDEQMALLDAAKFIATPESDVTGGSPLTPAQVQAAQQRQAQIKAQQQARMQGGPGQGPGQNPNGGPPVQGASQPPQQ